MARRTVEDAAKTREAILDAALQVFAERGFAAAQLGDIAARAGVTRGALYHHFTDKAALFLAALEERWTSVMTPVLGALRSGRKPEARLRAFVVAFLRTMENDEGARALMKMSLSGDMALPEFAARVTDKLDALGAWRTALVKVLTPLVPSGSAETRAEALLVSLMGYAVWTSLGAVVDEGSREAFADIFTAGVLA